MTDFEKDYYEQEIFWGKMKNSQIENARAEQTIKLIPPDVHRILDAGCGDGIISNRLALSNDFQVIAIDFSQAALKYVKVFTILGTVDVLPFSDRSFDLIICAEVLEHLPVDVYSRTLKQLQRVSDKYIIISVPNNEQIQLSFAKCGVCGSKFHVNHHIRSFTVKDLINLFDKYELINHVFMGPLIRYYPSITLRVSQFFGGFFAPTDFTICPQCGNRHKFVHKRNIATRLFFNLPYKILPERRKPRWLLGLYRRTKD